MEDKEVLFKNKRKLIILVPGFFPTIGLRKWKKVFEKEGYLVETAELHKFLPIRGIKGLSKKLDEEIGQILHKHEKEEYTLVAFSLGAVVSLYFLHESLEHTNVEKCIFISAPFHGFRYYLLSISPLFFGFYKCFRRVMPWSKFIKEFINPKKMEGLQIYTVCATGDSMCSKGASQLSFAKNLPPVKTGHAGTCFAFSEEAVKIVLNILKKKNDPNK
ncbi:esterase/lipase family protein [Patescibacteria group bacterium]